MSIPQVLDDALLAAVDRVVRLPAGEGTRSSLNDLRRGERQNVGQDVQRALDGAWLFLSVLMFAAVAVTADGWFGWVLLPLAATATTQAIYRLVLDPATGRHWTQPALWLTLFTGILVAAALLIW